MSSFASEPVSHLKCHHIIYHLLLNVTNNSTEVIKSSWYRITRHGSVLGKAWGVSIAQFYRSQSISTADSTADSTPEASLAIELADDMKDDVADDAADDVADDAADDAAPDDAAPDDGATLLESPVFLEALLLLLILKVDLMLLRMLGEEDAFTSPFKTLSSVGLLE